MADNNINKESPRKNIYKINDLYTILFDKKLGGGAFGKIYSCINNKTNELYACKVEKPNIENPQLINEYKILSALKNCQFYPKCYKFCSSPHGNLLVLDFLGPNLEKIMSNLPNKRYSMKSTLMIMAQCLERLKEIHDKGIIHRDMKPENLVIGYKGKEKNIYLIDFGLSKSIIGEKKNFNLLSIKKEKIVVGTVRYISMNTHLGNEQYKKDDLESLAYIMVYFIKGELPWQNIKAKSRKEKYSKIYQLKKKMVPNELCNFLPEEMKTFLNYILNLSVKVKPDYSKLMNLINNLMNKYSYCNDLQFDWCSTSFLKMIYNSPVIDDGEQVKSTSIYEEDSSNSDYNIKKLKENRYVSTSTKKKKMSSNAINKMKTFKISSKDINNLLYKQSAFSSNAIKNSLNLYMNGNEKKKDEYKNLAFSMNNCVNDNFFNRQRLSSY
jgi:serine/threonine protein kinase